jgi:hypothetical protein
MDVQAAGIRAWRPGFAGCGGQSRKRKWPWAIRVDEPIRQINGKQLGLVPVALLLKLDGPPGTLLTF